MAIKAYKDEIRLLRAENDMLRLEKEELIEYYSKDSCTGFFTKRHLKPAIESLISQGEIFSFAVIDLDDFKRVNDDHGHEIGDIVLHDTACIIRNTVRDSDKVIRYGGDEIMIILPEVDIHKAKPILERIRWRIEDSNLYGVTCSIGLVDFRKGDVADGIIQRADALMYASKGNGKNQITVDREDNYAQ